MSQYVVPNPEKNFRPVTELLSMDSYQDMTDEEILSIIRYREQVVSNKAMGAAKMMLAEQLREIEGERCAEACDNAKRMLEYYMEQEIPWVTLGGDSE